MKNKLGYGCPVKCKYCMVTHIDSRREKWEEKHRFGINKTVMFINKLEGDPPIKDLLLDDSLFAGEYVGFEGITDCFNPIYKEDLEYMIEYSKKSKMKKLVLVTKWNISKDRLRKLQNNNKILLVVTVTGLDILEEIKTSERIRVIKDALDLNINVLPIIHPYIHKLSDISFVGELARMGIREIPVKGLRYNHEHMGYWAEEYMDKEVLEIYKNNQEDEILVGEDYIQEIFNKYNIKNCSFREYVHRDNGISGVSYEEAKKAVDTIFKECVVSSSDSENVYEYAIKRRM